MLLSLTTISKVIGLSLQEIASKIEYIGTDIRELQAYKKRLQTALTLAKELVADVLIQNGVDRVDGNFISSLTLQAESISTKSDVVILDENKVMTLGYVKFTPDIEAIKIALATSKGKIELEGLVSVISFFVASWCSLSHSSAILLTSAIITFSKNHL